MTAPAWLRDGAFDANSAAGPGGWAVDCHGERRRFADFDDAQAAAEEDGCYLVALA